MRDVKHVFKMIGSVICCLLCIAAIVAFVYAISKTPPPTEPELYAISSNTFLNSAYYLLLSGLNYNPLFVIVSLVALVFEILFSRPLVFLFSQLPLGQIAGSGGKPLTMKTRLFPALLIGLAAIIDIIYSELSRDSFMERAELLNWIFLAVIGIAFVAQLISLLSDGGIWRSLVSGGLLIAANIGIGCLIGLLGTLLCLAFVGLAAFFVMIIAGILICWILSISWS